MKTKPARFLIFRQSSLGDVILALPVIGRLKAAFSNCTIDFVTKANYGQILENDPSVDRVYAFSSNSDFKALVAELKKIDYDYLIDLQANFRSFYLGFKLPGAKILRYKKRRLARGLIVRFPKLKIAMEHTILAYLEPLRSLGIESAMTPPTMSLPQSACLKADKFILDNNLTGKNLIALCPGAKHPEKMWPHSNFGSLASMLLSDPDNAILVFSAKADNFPEKLEITDKRLIPVRDLPLLDVAALLYRCSFALTNDSGLMHLANSVGTRVAAIFGPTHPRLGFYPSLPGSKVICDDLYCSPCSLHGRRKCHQPSKYCFEKITADRVFAEIVDLSRSHSN